MEKKDFNIKDFSKENENSLKTDTEMEIVTINTSKSQNYDEIIARPKINNFCSLGMKDMPNIHPKNLESESNEIVGEQLNSLDLPNPINDIKIVYTNKNLISNLKEKEMQKTNKSKKCKTFLQKTNKSHKLKILIFSSLITFILLFFPIYFLVIENNINKTTLELQKSTIEMKIAQAQGNTPLLSLKLDEGVTISFRNLQTQCILEKENTNNTKSDVKNNTNCASSVIDSQIRILSNKTMENKTEFNISLLILNYERFSKLQNETLIKCNLAGNQQNKRLRLLSENGENLNNSEWTYSDLENDPNAVLVNSDQDSNPPQDMDDIPQDEAIKILDDFYTLQANSSKDSDYNSQMKNISNYYWENCFLLFFTVSDTGKIKTIYRPENFKNRSEIEIQYIEHLKLFFPDLESSKYSNLSALTPEKTEYGYVIPKYSYSFSQESNKLVLDKYFNQMDLVDRNQDAKITFELYQQSEYEILNCTLTSSIRKGNAKIDVSSNDQKPEEKRIYYDSLMQLNQVILDDMDRVVLESFIKSRNFINYTLFSYQDYMEEINKGNMKLTNSNDTNSNNSLSIRLLELQSSDKEVDLEYTLGSVKLLGVAINLVLTAKIKPKTDEIFYMISIKSSLFSAPLYVDSFESKTADFLYEFFTISYKIIQQTKDIISKYISKYNEYKNLIMEKFKFFVDLMKQQSNINIDSLIRSFMGPLKGKLKEEIIKICNFVKIDEIINGKFFSELENSNLGMGMKFLTESFNKIIIFINDNSKLIIDKVIEYLDRQNFLINEKFNNISQSIEGVNEVSTATYELVNLFFNYENFKLFNFNLQEYDGFSNIVLNLLSKLNNGIKTALDFIKETAGIFLTEVCEEEYHKIIIFLDRIDRFLFSQINGMKNSLESLRNNTLVRVSNSINNFKTSFLSNIESIAEITKLKYKKYTFALLQVKNFQEMFEMLRFLNNYQKNLNLPLLYDNQLSESYSIYTNKLFEASNQFSNKNILVIKTGEIVTPFLEKKNSFLNEIDIKKESLTNFITGLNTDILNFREKSTQQINQLTESFYPEFGNKLNTLTTLVSELENSLYTYSFNSGEVSSCPADYSMRTFSLKGFLLKNPEPTETEINGVKNILRPLMDQIVNILINLVTPMYNTCYSKVQNGYSELDSLLRGLFTDSVRRYCYWWGRDRYCKNYVVYLLYIYSENYLQNLLNEYEINFLSCVNDVSKLYKQKSSQFYSDFMKYYQTNALSDLENLINSSKSQGQNANSFSNKYLVLLLEKFKNVITIQTNIFYGEYAIMSDSLNSQTNSIINNLLSGIDGTKLNLLNKFYTTKNSNTIEIYSNLPEVGSSTDRLIKLSSSVLDTSTDPSAIQNYNPAVALSQGGILFDNKNIVICECYFTLLYDKNEEYLQQSFEYLDKLVNSFQDNLMKNIDNRVQSFGNLRKIQVFDNINLIIGKILEIFPEYNSKIKTLQDEINVITSNLNFENSMLTENIKNVLISNLNAFRNLIISSNSKILSDYNILKTWATGFYSDINYRSNLSLNDPSKKIFDNVGSIKTYNEQIIKNLYSFSLIDQMVNTYKQEKAQYLSILKLEINEINDKFTGVINEVKNSVELKSIFESLDEFLIKISEKSEESVSILTNNILSYQFDEVYIKNLKSFKEVLNNILTKLNESISLNPFLDKFLKLFLQYLNTDISGELNEIRIFLPDLLLEELEKTIFSKVNYLEYIYYKEIFPVEAIFDTMKSYLKSPLFSDFKSRFNFSLQKIQQIFTKDQLKLTFNQIAKLSKNSLILESLKLDFENTRNNINNKIQSYTLIGDDLKFFLESNFKILIERMQNLQDFKFWYDTLQYSMNSISSDLKEEVAEKFNFFLKESNPIITNIISNFSNIPTINSNINYLKKLTGEFDILKEEIFSEFDSKIKLSFEELFDNNVINNLIENFIKQDFLNEFFSDNFSNVVNQIKEYSSLITKNVTFISQPDKEKLNRQFSIISSNFKNSILNIDIEKVEQFENISKLLEIKIDVQDFCLEIKTEILKNLNLSELFDFLKCFNTSNTVLNLDQILNLLFDTNLSENLKLFLSKIDSKKKEIMKIYLNKIIDIFKSINESINHATIFIDKLAIYPYSSDYKDYNASLSGVVIHGAITYFEEKLDYINNIFSRINSRTPIVIDIARTENNIKNFKSYFLSLKANLEQKFASILNKIIKTKNDLLQIFQKSLVTSDQNNTSSPSLLWATNLFKNYSTKLLTKENLKLFFNKIKNTVIGISEYLFSHLKQIFVSFEDIINNKSTEVPEYIEILFSIGIPNVKKIFQDSLNFYKQETLNYLSQLLSNIKSIIIPLIENSLTNTICYNYIDNNKASVNSQSLFITPNLLKIIFLDYGSLGDEFFNSLTTNFKSLVFELSDELDFSFNSLIKKVDLEIIEIQGEKIKSLVKSKLVLLAELSEAERNIQTRIKESLGILQLPLDYFFSFKDKLTEKIKEFYLEITQKTDSLQFNFSEKLNYYLNKFSEFLVQTSGKVKEIVDPVILPIKNKIKEITDYILKGIGDIKNYIISSIKNFASNSINSIKFRKNNFIHKKIFYLFKRNISYGRQLSGEANINLKELGNDLKNIFDDFKNTFNSFSEFKNLFDSFKNISSTINEVKKIIQMMVEFKPEALVDLLKSQFIKMIPINKVENIKDNIKSEFFKLKDYFFSVINDTKEYFNSIFEKIIYMPDDIVELLKEEGKILLYENLAKILNYIINKGKSSAFPIVSKPLYKDKVEIFAACVIIVVVPACLEINLNYEFNFNVKIGIEETSLVIAIAPNAKVELEGKAYIGFYVHRKLISLINNVSNLVDSFFGSIFKSVRCMYIPYQIGSYATFTLADVEIRAGVAYLF